MLWHCQSSLFSLQVLFIRSADFKPTSLKLSLMVEDPGNHVYTTWSYHSGYIGKSGVDSGPKRPSSYSLPEIYNLYWELQLRYPWFSRFLFSSCWTLPCDLAVPSLGVCLWFPITHSHQNCLSKDEMSYFHLPASVSKSLTMYLLLRGLTFSSFLIKPLFNRVILWISSHFQVPAQACLLCKSSIFPLP